MIPAHDLSRMLPPIHTPTLLQPTLVGNAGREGAACSWDSGSGSASSTTDTSPVAYASSNASSLLMYTFFVW